MSAVTKYSDGFRASVRQQAIVIGALILRDMRTRFGRTALGYVIAIAWPLTHLLIILGAWVLLGRVALYGTNSTVFFATGIVPYILCVYPARMIMSAIRENKPMLMFPVVRVIDIIIARGILEMLTAFCVLIIFCFILFVFNVDFVPKNPALAVEAIAAIVFYSLSLGIFSSVIMSLFHMWVIAFVGITVVQWLTSGATFLPSNVAPSLQALLYFNPLMHCVEWLRSAYYDDYGSETLDKSYVIFLSLGLMMIGLAGERAVRGRLLMQ